MINKPTVYEGNKKYCFISYCHENEGTMFKIMKLMSGYGCRFWYDSAIPIGSEFPEAIAEHLSQAEVFIAFLSNAYMRSDFCRMELNYALKKKKKLLLFYIEQTKLTSGFEMRLAMIQSVLMYKRNDLDTLMEEVCTSEIIAPCMDHFFYEVQKESISLEKSIMDGREEIAQAHVLSEESQENTYLFSLQLLDKLKIENKPELKKVVYELQKIVGFLRNETNFGEGDSQILYCENQVNQLLEKLSKELADFSLHQKENQTSAVSCMLKCCNEISIQLKIRAERMKK